jgi:allantoin racemase
LRLLFLYGSRDSDKKDDPSFFEGINNALQQVSRQDTRFEVWGLTDNVFDVSESVYWYAHSKAVTDMIYKARKAEKEGFDGIVIGCVGAVDAEYALKEVLSIPVVGVGEASFLLALILGASFSILTYSDKAYAWLYKTVRDYGLENRCVSIRQAGRSWEELMESNSKERAYQKMLEQANLAIEEDHADVILLCSIGITELADYLRKRVAAAVVDPTEAGVKFAEMLVDLHKTKGLLHSKALTYKPSPNIDKTLRPV